MSSGRRVVLPAVVITALSCTTARAPIPIPVEFAWVGDDGLTLRLVEAVEARLGASPTLVLSHGARPGTVTLLIPSNAKWDQVGSEIEAHYTVELTVTTSALPSVHSGSCKESALAVCATQIVSWVEAAVRHR